MIFLKSQDCVFQWRFCAMWPPDVNSSTYLPPFLPLPSVARLPGRNSGQKAQKGPQKKKFLAEFWLILPKTGRKGAAENVQNKFLIFSCWPNFLDVLAGNFFGTWQHWKQGGQQAGFLAVPARPAGPLSSHTDTLSPSMAVTGSWDSVCWCDRVKMAQQCVVICSWFWLYTDCWCG